MKNVTSIYFKIIAISVVLFFSSFKTLQEEAYPEQIDWDTHFKAQPDEHSAFAAETVTTWHYNYNATVRNNHLHIDFKFSAGVVPEKSWVKPDRISNRKVSRQLLNHEQGHVYINFLLLKEGNIQIRNQKYTPSNYKRLIQATANKVSDYYNNLQNRYDNETKHGSDLEAQSRWDDFIRSELNKYR
ncbi:MAG: DUF922 domain-containing protein [Pedobacter sp.]|jgi:hypothetical protein|uniref:DUF922 domain-containing protein n=1 Tax=Pedobacter sp. TaxID=1411316 RepID=UPI003563A89C